MTTAEGRGEEQQRKSAQWLLPCQSNIRSNVQTRCPAPLWSQREANPRPALPPGLWTKSERRHPKHCGQFDTPPVNITMEEDQEEEKQDGGDTREEQYKQEDRKEDMDKRKREDCGQDEDDFLDYSDSDFIY